MPEIPRRAAAPVGRPVTPVKPILAAAPPSELIDRAMVAAALDRRGGADGGPDGVIGEAELAEAGITHVDGAARQAVNEGGERGDAITVSELARALQAERVALTAQGLVTVKDGKATLPDGRVVPASPWSFPEVADLRVLERYESLVPRLGRYNPSWPDSYYVDQVFDGYERVKVGTDRVYKGKDADGNDEYEEVDRYEDRPKYRDEIQYDRLWRDLSRVANDTVDLARDAEDPQIRAAAEGIRRALDQGSGGFWGWGHESSCRRVYGAMQDFDRIQRPRRPEHIVGGLHQTLEASKARVAEQHRIVAAYPLERVKASVAREAAHLRGFNGWKAFGMAIAGAAAGAGGWFGLGAVAASVGLPLAAVAAGAGVLGLGLGWLVVKLLQDREARGLERDLATFQGISPARNRKELEQHALAAYEQLQDAREATTLDALRTYEQDAAKVGAAMKAVADRADAETKALKGLEALVLRHAKKDG